MQSAYVLITTDAGTAGAVRDRLKDQPGVASVAIVAGPYDVIAELRGADVNDIAITVLNTIHGIEGVEHTTTCPILG